MQTINAESIAVMYELFSGPIYKYCLRLCRDDVLAQTITADVFAEVTDRISKGDGPRTNIRSYLYQCAYHMVIDHHRRSKSSAPLEVVLNMFDQDAAHPEFQIEHRETMTWVRSAMDTSLAPGQRHVLILRFINGLSLAETASELGKDIRAVIVQQHRALSHLRKVLDRERSQQTRKENRLEKTNHQSRRIIKPSNAEPIDPVEVAKAMSRFIVEFDKSVAETAQFFGVTPKKVRQTIVKFLYKDWN